MQDYTRLDVWVKAHAVFVDIFGETRRIRSRDLSALRRQLQRSAEGIPTNIVEGSSASTNEEFARYLGIALASAAETHYHLRAAGDIGAMPKARSEELAERVVEVRRMLYGLLKRVRGG
jgi:four helix bundle protein